ncbi:MAG TPA: hypothetical protein V6D06_17050 [Trichocoleus sp.]
MRNQCLPCKIIVRNVLVLLAAWAGILLFVADTHAVANGQSQRSEALRRLFLYQVATQMQQGS